MRTGFLASEAIAAAMLALVPAAAEWTIGAPRNKQFSETLGAMNALTESA